MFWFSYIFFSINVHIRPSGHFYFLICSFNSFHYINKYKKNYLYIQIYDKNILYYIYIKDINPNRTKE